MSSDEEVEKYECMQAVVWLQLTEVSSADGSAAELTSVAYVCRVHLDVVCRSMHVEGCGFASQEYNVSGAWLSWAINQLMLTLIQFVNVLISDMLQFSPDLSLASIVSLNCLEIAAAANV